MSNTRRTAFSNYCRPGRAMAVVSLHDAALMGDLEAVREALERGEDPNLLAVRSPSWAPLPLARARARTRTQSRSGACLRAPRSREVPRGVRVTLYARRMGSLRFTSACCTTTKRAPRCCWLRARAWMRRTRCVRRNCGFERWRSPVPTWPLLLSDALHGPHASVLSPTLPPERSVRAAQRSAVRSLCVGDEPLERGRVRWLARPRRGHTAAHGRQLRPAGRRLGAVGGRG